MGASNARAGEDQGLEEWLAADYPRAFRSACLILHNRADAQEAVQEAFLRVWRFRDSLPPASARTAWLYRVVVNACLSRLRAQRRRPEDLVDLGGWEASDPGPAPAESAEQGELAVLMLAALAELPEGQRVVLVLRYYSGLTEREIATAIRRRPGTVKSRLSEGRRRLALDPRLSAWVHEEEMA